MTDQIQGFSLLKNSLGLKLFCNVTIIRAISKVN